MNIKNVVVALVAVASLSLTGCKSDDASDGSFDFVEYATNKVGDIQSDITKLFEEKEENIYWEVEDEIILSASSEAEKAVEALSYILNDHAFKENGGNALLVMKTCLATKHDALSVDKLNRLEDADHDLFVNCWNAMMGYIQFDGRLRKESGSQRGFVTNVGDNMKGIHKEYNITKKDGIVYKYL
ncbi:MAG TPA: hypothetical protein DCL21_04020 [Alphaproteobacteria bacterium]|nr:hypothetical protein [Alphaproteobacteria bacterium]